MRSLVVLRGCPGAGKSTWIKENGLEPYTLSPDNIRMMASAPVLNEDNTDMTISQNNESYVWSLLYELLEKRMKNGDFTIIDATHSRSTDFSRYNSLCSTYRYRKYVVSFTDVPKEVCIERNHQRDAYKRVPDEVIEKMYARFATQEKTSGWVDVPRNEFWETFTNKCFDFNEYKDIHIIGDIHGCFEPLKEYILKMTYTEMQDDITPKNLYQFLNCEDAYIFVGDFLDRGLQNKEVLEFMISICNMKNVLLLEGNHEKWFWYYANELDNEIKSKEFLNNTVPQIRGINPSDIRQLYRKLGQMAYINFRDKKYFITHAGLSTFPKCLQLISTSQFINGVGAYKTPIDEIYTKNNQDIIQIHGHRNINEENEEKLNIAPYSYSLENRVEFGGNLVVAKLTNEGKIHIYKIKNNLFRIKTNEERISELRQQKLDLKNIVERLRSNNNVKESELGDGISSFNFTRKAFEKGRWNNETVKARGLFIDTINNRIVARGYEKFFNINEQESSKLFNLKRLFEYDDEVVAYKKYNGFLGILSYYNDNLQFHSKSTKEGEYVNYFKNLFYKQYNEDQIKIITEYLKNNNVSITFEVIDLQNDPHIIDEGESRVVLLDIIYNEVDFRKESYENMVKLAKELNLKESEYKQIYCKFNTYRQLTEFYEDHKNDSNLKDTDIEGVVIESSNFMTKLKFSYYTFWKMMRTVKEQVMKGRPVELGRLYNATSNYFYGFLKQKYNNKIAETNNILKEIGIKELSVSDINKCELDEDKIIVSRKIYNEDNEQIRYTNEQKEYVVGEDIVNRIQNLRKQEDIITLRNEFNNGIYEK